MKRFLALLLLCSTACAQTVNLTVVSDTNRVIRTNFTIGNAQVTGLGSAATNPASAFQPANATLTNLASNNAVDLTNVRASNVVGTVALASNMVGILAISNGGTGSQTASNARTALGLGTAATNAATAFQPASAALTNLANNDGAALTNLSATNFLPAYAGQDGKVLAVATGGTNIEWTALSNTVTDASTLTNFPAYILQTNSAETNFPSFLARTNSDGGSFTNIAISNIVGVLSIAQGGTGQTNASAAIAAFLPSYTNNEGKVLGLDTNLALIWTTNSGGGGGGTSGVTSVDVSGGSTGLTTSGGPITNSGTITLGGTLAIAAGGTGATNAAAAIESFLPAYTNNADKVLALNSNATGLVWTTNAGGGGGGGSGTVTSIDASGGSTGMNFTGGPVTTNGSLTLGGTLAIGSGGTGAGDAATARVNLLPAYTNNAGKVLAITSTTNDVEWVAVPSVPVTVAQGGTGGTNLTAAHHNLQLILSNENVTLVPQVSIASATNASSDRVVVAGYGAIARGQGALAIGSGAAAYTNRAVALGESASAEGGFATAVGYLAYANGTGAALGYRSYAENGAAAGDDAEATDGGAIGRGAQATDGFAGGKFANAYIDNGVQLGTGTNTNANTIQFLTAGSVTTNTWLALANSTYIGRQIIQAPTNGTDGQVLSWTNNDVAWITAGGGSGTIDLSTTNATGVLPVIKGGSGATSAVTALTNFGIYTFAGSEDHITIGLSQTVTGSTDGIAIGRAATLTNSDESIVVGELAKAQAGSRNVAIGYNAFVSNSVGAIQLGEGTLGSGNNSTIQFRAGGAVNETEWGYLANASAGGGRLMTNPLAALTNTSNVTAMRALSGSTNTNHPFSGTVSVVGTNNTNVLVFSNGVLQEVQ